MANLCLDKDGMYIDKVVARLVDFNERSHKSRNMLHNYCRGLRLEVWKTTTSQLRAIEKIKGMEEKSQHIFRV